MKKFTFSLLILIIGFITNLNAQTPLLPYGQDTSEPWSAKYFYAPSDGDTPPADWFAADFDDSAWGTIEGPIVADGYSNYLPYSATQWKDYDSNYWLRRTFEADDDILNGYKKLYLNIIHGDYCEVYLNGNLIYIKNDDQWSKISLYISRETAKNLKKGNNTIAVKTYGYYDRFIDLGLSYDPFCELNISVTTPGAMGDSILAKVENFADVDGLILSGDLNESDFETIQTRLKNLREIDMTNVNMLSIPNRFFYNRDIINVVKLPSRLTSIGNEAFYQCYALENVIFPEGLQSIGSYAFYDCNSLTEAILPEGLKTIGNNAFYHCDNIKHVKFPSTITTISYGTFEHNTNLESVEFAEGLSAIKGMAFYECSKLNNISFPNSLRIIENNAFSYDKSITNITFNEGLYQIEDNAFYDCDGLTEITLPSSLVLANESPFDYCDNLTKVTCLSIEPPYMTDQIPYGCSMEGRELYVPALSINAYKQSIGWDKFETIKPIDHLPENITVLTDFHLTLPENIPADYKPYVRLIAEPKSYYQKYGRLTVNGEGTLSMSHFRMKWDPNYLLYSYDNSICYTSLINNSHLRSDSVSAELLTRNDRWTFISFPFDVKISDIETISDGTTNWIIRKYDGKARANGSAHDTWVKMTNDSILKAGVGYILQSSRYINNNDWQEASGFLMRAINNSNKNNLFRTEDITVPLNEYLSEFSHNRSWNLIGNPYPSFFDTRFMEYEAPITVWNQRNNTYEAYSPIDDAYILCPGEAFFVQRPVNQESITFNLEGRQTTRNARTIEEPLGTRAAFASRSVVNLSISDGNVSDRTRIVINDEANMDYESDKDASKFMSLENSIPQIYSSANGVDFAINERPMNDGDVQLSIRIGAEGIHTITLNESAINIVYLEDNYQNKITAMMPGDEYAFTSEEGIFSDRFILHLNPNFSGIGSILDSDAPADDSYYTIDGIKVANPTAPGIYIRNNKKIIIKK